MKIGTLLGLAIAVALVVSVRRWLRARAAQKPGTFSRDPYDNATPGFSYFGNGDNNTKTESGSDDRANKGDDAGTPWVSFDSPKSDDTRSDNSTDSGGDSGGGDGGGGGGGGGGD